MGVFGMLHCKICFDVNNVSILNDACFLHNDQLTFLSEEKQRKISSAIMNTFSKRKKKTENGAFLDFIKNTPLSFYFIGIFSRTKLDKQRVLDFF
jgi:hypothetical protein